MHGTDMINEHKIFNNSQPNSVAGIYWKTIPARLVKYTWITKTYIDSQGYVLDSCGVLELFPITKYSAHREHRPVVNVTFVFVSDISFWTQLDNSMDSYFRKK